jgi:hypothetical protein
LCLCCVWHSCISSSNIELSTKVLIDKIVLCVFATIFLSIQIVFFINLRKSISKTKEFAKREAKFISRHAGDEVESDDEE